MGFLSSVYVGSALIDLYARVGLVRAASNLFDEIPVRSTVCANALISGLWREMWVSVACSTGLSAVGLGKEVHAVLISTVCDVGGDVFLQSSLIEMYGKSGFVDKARYVFDLEGIERVGERKRDVVLWTTMLGVYSRNGKFEEVIELYGEMLGEGTKPDRVVFSECGNVEMGVAAKRTLELDPQNVGIYVLLSNLYAGVGMWDEIRELRKVMQEKGLKKDVGYSWVDVNRKLI
ncbi:hypothetical protein GIB67_017135 [Kingdonia uniflora]|uniref:Pentatricopeptide repeat-containing protein n=1 Tax=Kingdonia uniflora TaxID=39325 RepID=A0A7J7P024_9MAGN|nr:hypothetical protein GIB67_017135 [Kingdonia uniflora]